MTGEYGYNESRMNAESRPSRGKHYNTVYSTHVVIFNISAPALSQSSHDHIRLTSSSTNSPIPSDSQTVAPVPVPVLGNPVFGTMRDTSSENDAHPYLRKSTSRRHAPGA